MRLYIECTAISQLNTLMDTLTLPDCDLREIEITLARSSIANHIGIEALILLKKKANCREQLKKIPAIDTVLCAIESV